MNVSESLENIRSAIPKSVRLIAVSKTKSVETIMEAYDAGQKVFGENKVQELASKKDLLPEDIEWHYIGHLQTNKVKYLAPFVDMIHAVDSMKLLKEINKQALKNSRTVNCLLQIHIAEEDSKFGLSEGELFSILESEDLNELRNINIKGLMGMATLTYNDEQIRKEFRYLKGLFEKVQSRYSTILPGFTEISMGMSGDYEIAIEEGSTMVRIGSSIFGARH